MKMLQGDLSEKQFSRKSDRNIYQLWSQKEVICYNIYQLWSQKEVICYSEKTSDLVRLQNN